MFCDLDLITQSVSFNYVIASVSKTIVCFVTLTSLHNLYDLITYIASVSKTIVCFVTLTLLHNL